MTTLLAIFIGYVMYITMRKDAAKHKRKKRLKEYNKAVKKREEDHALSHLFEDDK
jgi:archaellum biogenesis protein FlaJ (TadC family)